VIYYLFLSGALPVIFWVLYFKSLGENEMLGVFGGFV
jgi:hypothetical protein